jgi:hypothetical protein
MDIVTRPQMLFSMVTVTLESNFQTIHIIRKTANAIQSLNVKPSILDFFYAHVHHEWPNSIASFDQCGEVNAEDTTDVT